MNALIAEARRNAANVRLRRAAVTACLGFAAVCGFGAPVAVEVSVESLDPKRWHEPARVRLPDVRAHHEALRQALLNGDAKRVTSEVTALIAALGPEVSVPEAPVDYAGKPDVVKPDVARLQADWLAQTEEARSRDPWDIARAAKQKKAAPPRLRDSQRLAEAYLATARVLGPTAGERFRARAMEGLRYIQRCQTMAGVFGYPYDPTRTDRLGRQATKIVQHGEKSAHAMIEDGWIVDDLGGGDLQFDNGVCGLAMLHAYEVTGEASFLESARRAADWAMARPLVANWNYNSFAARLLAAVYLATKEQRYADAAIRFYDIGVLPGQTATGRWFDPHNARTPYHAILATALVDYVRLLEALKSPRLPEVTRATQRALDNLAAQALAFGASNVQEMLPLEAFWRGTDVLGRHEQWDRAAVVFLNALGDGKSPARRENPLPPSVPFALLQLTAKK